MINFILMLLEKVTPRQEGRGQDFVRWLISENPLWFVKTLPIEVKMDKGRLVVLNRAQILKELRLMTGRDEAGALILVEKLAEINPCTAYVTRGPFARTLEIETQPGYSGIIRRYPRTFVKILKNPIFSARWWLKTRS